MATRAEWRQTYEQAVADGDEDHAETIALAFKRNTGVEITDPPDPGKQGNDVTEPLEFNPAAAVTNLPGSAIDLYQTTLDAAMDPVETIKGAGQLAIGSLQKGADWLGENISPYAGVSIPGMILESQGVDYRAAPEAFAETVGERYGSPQAALTTLEEDPAGVGMDLTALIAPVNPRLAAEINPQTVVPRAAAGAGRVIPERVPESMMSSATKLPTTLPAVERAGMVRTMLDEGVSPSPRGVEKLSGRIKQVSDRVDTMIATAERTGQGIPIDDVLAGLQGLRRQRGSSVVSGAEDVAAIDDLINTFKSNAELQNKTVMTAADLQKFKRDLYDRIAWNARRGTDVPPVTEEVYKTAARGARENIEGLAPDVAAANRRLGNLLELEPHLQRASGRIENANLFGMQDFLTMGGGALTGQAFGRAGLGAAVGIVADLLTNPKVSPTIARVLEWARKPGPIRNKLDQWLVENPMASQGTVVAYLESLAEEIPEEEEARPPLAP
jgi:hypothetical protein